MDTIRGPTPPAACLPALVALLLGCDAGAARHAPPSSHAVPSDRSSAPALRSVDAADGAADPESERPRALPAVVAACVARLHRDAPPELAAALATLDADSLLEDSCRLDVAVAAHDPGLCADVHLSVLRDHCAARSAMAAGLPDRCPAAPGLHGRDPACVAIAARAPGLCTAAGPVDGVRCLALARRDPRACSALDPLLRPRCTREVEALRGLLPPMRGPALPAGTAHVVLGRIAQPAQPDADAPAGYDVRTWARGVFLDDAGTLWLVDPARGWPTEFATRGDATGGDATGGDAPEVAAEVPLIGTRPQASRASRASRAPVTAEARVLLPHGASLDTRDPTTRATVRLDALPRRRGDPVAGELTVDGLTGATPVHLVVSFRTFVRDVVPPAMVR